MDILLVDHSAADAYLTKLALNEAFLDSRVCVAEDGEQVGRLHKKCSLVVTLQGAPLLSSWWAGM